MSEAVGKSIVVEMLSIYKPAALTLELPGILHQMEIGPAYGSLAH